MNIARIVYTLALYTVVAVPTFVVSADALNINIGDAFATISSGTIQSHSHEIENLPQPAIYYNDDMLMTNIEEGLDTIAPAAGGAATDIDSEFIRKLLETEARNQAMFDEIFAP